MKKILVIALVALAACGFVFAKGASEASPAAEAGPKPELTTLKVWYSISGNNGKFFESQAQAFDEAHPEIALELTYTGKYSDTATKVSAAKVSGEAPDVLITAASQLYTGEDGNFTIEEDVKDAEFKFDDIQTGVLEYAKYNDRLASLPFGISTQVMYYNKNLAKAAGVDLEKNPPKTWSEFVTVASAIQKASGNPDVWGFDTSDGVWLIKSMLNQNGNSVVQMKDGKIEPVFTEANAIEVADFWKSLVDSKLMPAGQHDNAEKKFLAGNLVFVAATSNRISKWAGSTDFELGAIEMPYFKKQSVAMGGSTATIMATDYWKHDASWQLLKFVLNTDNQTAFALTSGYLPIRKSSLEMADVKSYVAGSELYSVAIKQLSYAWAYTHFAEMGSMDSFFWYALDEIERGVKTPEQAFKDASASLVAEME
ncbi:MAG: ABC transporter substrate-binding protein [Sphaerochaetaceae bacterium]|nr:ABC transporter substrate-binding protein [Sphaerochaetaceae bacterium]MDD3162801.1 ABC transporter substrate-binding protein [Sphaerochaetaceae bacterium]MDD4006874.1 ABC transporter substrate-binding protein [Sphaerochaetaceae bacterium]MDD4396006.1 ABC transporter substrate-binding protein [Sphaerochaetaceae bacterium]